jgi:L-ascorbate metabolism protein UlaG (beta-lactamase superfamily)
MRIHWYGHSAFHILTDQGTSLILDPYQSGAYDNALAYGPIKDRADIVTTSHDHPDHCYTKDIQGQYTLINQAGAYDIKDVKIETIPAFHDPSEGKERGRILMAAIKADGISLVHLGDLGHSFDADLLKKIGKVDILLIPIGGFFTIDPTEATAVMNALKPAITIPMHYKTQKCAFPIAPVEDFIKGKQNVRNMKSSDVVIEKDTLPAPPEIIVLQHAL